MTESRSAPTPATIASRPSDNCTVRAPLHRPSAAARSVAGHRGAMRKRFAFTLSNVLERTISECPS